MSAGRRRQPYRGRPKNDFIMRHHAAFLKIPGCYGIAGEGQRPL